MEPLLVGAFCRNIIAAQVLFGAPVRYVICINCDSKSVNHKESFWGQQQLW